MLGKFIAPCEDSLTAAVFTHLLHLPSELFWQILRDACHTENLPKFAGEMESYEFWPKWDASRTHNSNYVEPDVFIRFPDFDLIVEAKRWDERMQFRSQWESELIAYANEYGAEKCPVKMIAVGGIHSEPDDMLTHRWSPSSSGEAGGHDFVCPVHMCRWQGLLDRCKRMRHELERLNYPSSQSLATGRILDDLINLFGSHGFSTGLWFKDFSFDQYRLSPSISPHLRLFQNRSSQLSTT